MARSTLTLGGALALLALPALARAQSEVPLEAHLLAADAAAGPHLFGSDAAISGDRAIVGATLDSTQAFAGGAAYVFERTAGGAWAQVAKFFPVQGVYIGEFGKCVEIDGDTAAVLGPGFFHPGPPVDAVYVYERLGGVWTKVAMLRPSDTPLGFGGAISISGDRLLVGSPGDDDLAKDSGAAYVFHRDASGVWSEEAKLVPPGAVAHRQAGLDVALSGDRALIGSLRDFAWIYERTGTTWSLVAELVPPASGKQSGHPVALDGDTALVGWPEHSLNTFGGSSGPDPLGWAGAVRVYTRQADGTWPQTVMLVPELEAPYSGFGSALALSGDRAWISQGRLSWGVDFPARVHEFVRDASGAWHQAQAVADPGGTVDSFNWDVDLSGTLGLVTAERDSTAGEAEGGAFVFELEPLAATTATLSAATGGTQELALGAGIAHAGEPYVLLSTTAGTAPGLPLPGGLELPLAFSPLLEFTLAQPNVLVQPSLALLDGGGRGSAALAVGPLDPALAGVTVHHAYAVLSLPALTPTFVSNAVALELVP